jgi:tetratricopeptide (TPR) repeat protein
MRATQKARTLLVFLLAFPAIVPTATRAQPGDPDPSNQLIVEGFKALRSDELDDAASAFRKALALAPAAQPALLGLSQALERQGDPVAALQPARRAYELTPESSAAALLVARLLARIGAANEALAVLDRSRDLHPEEQQGYLLSALLLRDLGRRDEAIGLLEEALALGLTGPELPEELALLLVAAERPDEARQLATETLADYGPRADLELALGLALAADPESRTEAVTRLEKALALEVSEPGRVHLELGKLLIETGRPAEAIEHLTTAAELLPDSEEVFYRLGAAQRATGDADGARESLEHFQELKRRRENRERLDLQVGTALNEAQTLAAANRLTAALERVSELLESHPEEPRAHLLRAKILFSLQQLEASLAAVSRARQLDPTLIEAHYLEGMFLLHSNRPEEARAALTRAVALDSELGEAYVLLGGASAKLGRPDEAVTYFARALGLGVDSPALRLGYAAALESLGRLDESAQQNEAYLRLVQHPQ